MIKELDDEFSDDADSLDSSMHASELDDEMGDVDFKYKGTSKAYLNKEKEEGREGIKEEGKDLKDITGNDKAEKVKMNREMTKSKRKTKKFKAKDLNEIAEFMNEGSVNNNSQIKNLDIGSLGNFDISSLNPDESNFKPVENSNN